jgi:hypothetical protein
MTSHTQLRLALVACTIVFSTCFVIDDVSGQCWRKHTTILPQTYPIWTMYNGIDPFQRTYFPRTSTSLNVCGSCASVLAAANVWVTDSSAEGGAMAEAPTVPMVPLVPAESIQDGRLPDADVSPSDVITAPPTPDETGTAQSNTDELAKLKVQLEEATQRARAAEERAYASDKSARAAQTAAEKRISELEKEIEKAKKD